MATGHARNPAVLSVKVRRVCVTMHGMTHALLAILFGALLLPGLAMVFVPFLPAFWYLLAVAALFGAIDGFTHLTLQNLAVLAGLFVASLIVDWSAGLLGARLGGAAWRSLLLGALGAFLGLLLFPPFGAFAGLFFGVACGELCRRRETSEALRAAAGAAIGTASGMLLNAAIALTFIVLFFVFAR